MNIRIFFSSPGDVKMERETAKRIVDRLQSEIGAETSIQPYFWEHEAMVATKDYQQNIPAMDDFDIVVCILWSRLGTPLDPERHPKPGGGGFESGTEYEFFTAMQAHELKGSPDIFVFQNTTEPRRPSRPKEVRESFDREIDRLDSFFDRYFQDEEFFTRAINIYSTLGEFEEKLTIALRSYITGRIPSATAAPSAKKRTYHRQPYLGLASFDYADSPVFFGRTAEVGEIIANFQSQELEAQTITETPPKHFVLILGSSGSGKSSLARAGVLPMLTNPGVIEGADAWRTAIFKPAEVSGDPILALVNSLNTPMALPELFADGTTPAEIAGLIRSQPQGGGLLLRQALTQAGALALTKRKHQLSEKIDSLLAGGRSEDARLLREKIETLSPPSVRIAVLADQLEELFTSDLSPETLKTFIGILVAMANSGRIFLLATLRSDFYPRCLEHQELVDLMQGSGTYALPAPSASNIGQMIRQPASIAGLTFEENPTSGEKLDELLRDEALKDPAALPLLSYTLEQLYEQRTGNGMLTLDAYRKLGGIEGAIGSRAETVFTSLPSDAQSAFDPLCKQLVTLQEGGQPTRRRAYYTTLTRSPESKILVDALIAARLLTADQSNAGERTVSVAHEALLHHWPRLVSWVDENRLFLNTRTRVASRLSDWLEHGKSQDYLIPKGPNLSSAESILTGHLSSLDPLEIEFIGKSVDRARTADHRKLRNARLITAGAIVLCLFALAGGLIAMRENRTAQRERKTALTQKQEAEIQKGKAIVSAARATKSEARTSYILGIEQLEKGNTRAGLVALSQTLALDPDHQGAMDRLYSQHLYGLPKAIPVRSVAFDPGKSLARQRISGAVTGPRQLVAYLGNEKSVEVFDLVTRETVPGPWEQEPSSFASLISYDSRTVWNIREDFSIHLWDVATGKPTKVLQADPQYSQLATTGDGSLFIQALRDEKVTVYSTRDGAEVDSWRQKGETSFIGEDSSHQRLISVSQHEIVIYDIPGETHTQPIPVGEGYVSFMTRQALEMPLFANVTIHATNAWQNKKKISIHSSETGLPIPMDTPIESDTWVTAIYFNSTADIIYVAFENGDIIPYSIPGGEPLPAIRLPAYASKMTVSPDDRLLVTATPDGTVRIHDLSSGSLAFDPINHDGGLEDLGISWDGRYVIAATRTHARVWDLAAGPALNLPVSTSSPPWSHGIDRENNQLVISTRDGYQKFDLMTMAPATGLIPPHPDATGSILSGNGSLFAEYRSDSTVAFLPTADGTFSDPKVWDAGSEAGFWHLSPDGSIFAWQEEERVTFVATSSAEETGETTTLSAPSRGISALTDSNDTFITITFPEDHLDQGNQLELVDLPTRETRTLGPGKFLFELLATSPDSRWLAAAGRSFGQANDNRCYIWDLRNPTSPPLEFSAGESIYQIFFSQDSRLAAYRSRNQQIQVCNLTSGKKEGAPLSVTHAVPVSALFSPDNTRIATLSHRDGQSLVQIWDWREQIPVSRTFEIPGKSYSLFYNRDGSKISALWPHHIDHSGNRHLFGQWETTPSASAKQVLIPLTEFATACRTDARGNTVPCDPYDAWREIHRIDPGSWFLRPPLGRTISPRSSAAALDWLNFPYTTFDTFTSSMPAVGLIHASIARWLQNDVNNKESYLEDLDPGQPEIPKIREIITNTKKRIARHVDLAERNAFNDPDTQFALAQQAINTGDNQRAAEFLSSSLALRPDHRETLRTLADIYEAQRDFAETSLYLRKLHHLAPADMQVMADLATNLWKAGEKEEASTFFPKLKDSEVLTPLSRAYILLLSAEPEAALPYFEEAARLRRESTPDGTNDSDCYIYLITGLYHAGKLPEAVAHYRELIALVPFAAVEQNLGGIYLGPEFQDAMVRTLRETLAQYPALASEQGE